ncbi:MAG: hypothetical protein ABSF80_06760 [Chitinispirillaceae bacterium]|jgi:hypothetical protein
MKEHRLLLAATAVAVVLSLFIIFRAFAAKADFDRAVHESLKTTEGYDQRFIDRVNRLEELLATRAQFGYSGGKDPMTGTKRQVVQIKQQPPPPPVRTPRAQQQTAAPVAETAPAPQPDQMRLTAIIADATGRKITAVVMDGERSFSVEQGDLVSGRKITRITNEGIYMESDSMMYFYDIYGNVVRKSKDNGTVSPVLQEEQQPKKTAPVKPPPPAKKRKK